MKARRGTMTMEAILVLPLLLSLICGIFQLAGLAMARVMTEYAAYCAARVLVVTNSSDRNNNLLEAAARALGPVAGTFMSGIPRVTWARNAVEYPGWGSWLGAASLDKQVQVSVTERDVGNRSDPSKYHRVTVQFDYPLTVPVAGAMLAAVLPNGRQVESFKTVRLKASSCAVGLTDNIYPRITR